MPGEREIVEECEELYSKYPAHYEQFKISIMTVKLLAAYWIKSSSKSQ